MNENEFILREANIEDVDLLFKWVNEPITRQMSLNQNSVDYENHISWFQRALAEKKQLIFILEYLKEPVGQIRFTLDGEGILLSYFVDSDHRGKGIGKMILDLGIAEVGKIYPNSVVKGQILEENIASHRAFQSVGFKVVGREVIGDRIFVDYSLTLKN